jgi:hypothetical protein
VSDVDEEDDGDVGDGVEDVGGDDCRGGSETGAGVCVGAGGGTYVPPELE